MLDMQGWHKHSNGGGWVQDTAHVAESAYVGPNAEVFLTTRRSSAKRGSADTRWLREFFP